MELSDLRVLRAVVHEGGVTRAAERLGRVQSAVTSRIQQLEKRVQPSTPDPGFSPPHLTESGQEVKHLLERNIPP